VSHPVVAARRAEQRARVDAVRDWAPQVVERLPGTLAVVVFGSVARGDFNLWSDTDVLVVADGLPERLLDRYDRLPPVPPRVQPVLWTPAELAEARRRRNPVAVEADSVGVVVAGALPRAPGTAELPAGVPRRDPQVTVHPPSTSSTWPVT
jgi:hypothetical protein